MKIAMIVSGVVATAAMTLAAGTASGQFTGKLVYQIVRPTEVLIMTYYQNGTNVQVSAYSMPVKNGVADTSTLFVQDTILYDLAKNTETHLQRASGYAIIAPYTLTTIAQTRYGQTLPPVSVQQVVNDTARGYSCTRFVMMHPAGKLGKPSQTVVWVTNSLGIPGIEVMGSYLYYTPGSQQLQAMISAGCTGVVVRAQINALGQLTTMNLINADTHTPQASLFRVPSYYTIVDHSGYVPAK
jgi:hypothetical protein